MPAIFAITNEPFIVYTSNVFAILGLRSTYFLLAGAVGRFHLLRYGLAAVLIFVGLKMSWLNVQWDGHFPITISLGVIAFLLAASVGLSFVFEKPKAPADQAMEFWKRKLLQFEAEPAFHLAVTREWLCIR